MIDEKFHWLDVRRIAEELVDHQPDADPSTISFPALRDLVQRLPRFEAREGHPCNERILEAIQAAWIEEQDD